MEDPGPWIGLLASDAVVGALNGGTTLTFNIAVKDGTHAGWRRLHPAPTAWKCSCGTENEAHWSTCKSCNTQRS